MSGAKDKICQNAVIAGFLAVLEKDVETGRTIWALADDMASSMLWTLCGHVVKKFSVRPRYERTA